MRKKDAPLLSFPRKELLILDLLAEHGKMFGLQLVRTSQGGLKRGTVYVTLGRLIDKGWVQDEPAGVSDGGIPIRLYSITASGIRVLEAASMARQALAWGTR